MGKLASILFLAPLVGCAQSAATTQAEQLLKQFVGDWKISGSFASASGGSGGATTASVFQRGGLAIFVENLSIQHPLFFALQYDPKVAKYILNAIVFDIVSPQQMRLPEDAYDLNTARYSKLADKYKLIVGLPMEYSDSNGWQGKREGTTASIKKKGSGTEWNISSGTASVTMEFRERVAETKK